MEYIKFLSNPFLDPINKRIKECKRINPQQLEIRKETAISMKKHTVNFWKMKRR